MVEQGTHKPLVGSSTLPPGILPPDDDCGVQVVRELLTGRLRLRFLRRAALSHIRNFAIMKIFFLSPLI